MKPETSRKRLHSALKEPPIAQGGKRKRHDLKSTQQAMIHQTGVFSFEKRSFQSHSRNKPRSSKQAEPPESLSSFTDPEPRSAQGSEVYIGNSVKQGFAPDGSSSPATDYSPSNRLSVNKRRCLKQTPLLCRAHRNAIIQSSEDSFDEKGRFIVTSEHSLSNSSLPTDDVNNPSSPDTVSDYRSFGSETESEFRSEDESISTRSTSSPCAFNRSATSMPDSSDLKSRIRSFLPAIQAANETLERERAEGRLVSRNIEDVDENDEQYIEMNLGLGVLEEKKRREISWKADGSESESESESDGDSESDGESEDAGESDLASKTESDFVSETDSEFASESDSGSPTPQPQRQPPASTHKEQETNHLARMMGQPRQPAKKPIIEVLPTD